MKRKKLTRLRAFLYFFDEYKEWRCKAYSDYEQLYAATSAIVEQKESIAVIHVAFHRPNSFELKECDSEIYHGRVLVTQATLGTLPDPISYSSKPIISTKNYDVYLVLEGFNYSINDPTLNHEANRYKCEQKNIERNSECGFGPRGWVKDLCEKDAQILEVLKEANIETEQDYLALESKLDFKYRLEIGSKRFQLLAGQQAGIDNIITDLAYAPPWLLNAPISLLNLTTRPQKALESEAIEYIGNLKKYSDSNRGLTVIPRLGRKSINEVLQELLSCFLSGKPLIRDVDQQLSDAFSQGQGEYNKFLFNQLDRVKDLGKQFVDGSIGEGFTRILSRIESKSRQALVKRIGYQCEPVTLEETGQIMNLTRQRIQQLEKTALNHFKEDHLWLQLRCKMYGLLKDRDWPLYLAGLSAYDPWFEGIDRLFNPLVNVLNSLEIGMYCWKLNGEPLITTISHGEFDENIKEAESLIYSMIEDTPSVEEVKSLIKNTFPCKAPELGEFVWNALQPNCIILENEDQTQVLAGYGSTNRALVAAILRVSSKPLHASEILECAKSNGYDKLVESQISNIALDVGYLFGRGTYGLKSHIPLTQAELSIIRQEIERFVIANPSENRQWSSEEFSDLLMKREIDFKTELDINLINIALSNSEKLHYLGRDIWVLKGKEIENNSSRIHLHQAITSILESAGEPLSTNEIREAIIKERGLASNFQIHEKDRVIKLGKARWGLKDRDINLEVIRPLVTRLIERLKRLGHGMHLPEVQVYLAMSDWSKLKLIKVVGEEEGLRLSEDGYFYLAEWGETRRKDISQAIKEVLLSATDGIKIIDLHAAVERLTGRTIARKKVLNHLNEEHAFYDAEHSIWRSSHNQEVKPIEN